MNKEDFFAEYEIKTTTSIKDGFSGHLASVIDVKIRSKITGLEEDGFGICFNFRNIKDGVVTSKFDIRIQQPLSIESIFNDATKIAIKQILIEKGIKDLDFDLGKDVSWYN